jgi:hypothetical protein
MQNIIILLKYKNYIKRMNEITNPKLNKKVDLLNYENQEINENDKISLKNILIF